MRVEIAKQGWGWICDASGNGQAGQSVQIKNTDATNATHWSAITGGSSSTAVITTASDGTIGRYIETGTYDVYVGGVLQGRVETTAGETVRVVAEAPLNVRYPEYGATGDGSTDDVTTMQAAVTAAAGGSVLVPNGDYKVSAALTVPSNTRMFGEGAGSKITVTTNDNVIENSDQSAGNTNVVVEGLWCIGTGASGTPFQKGIYFKKVTDGEIRGCVVTNTYLQGIQVDVAVRNRIVSNSVTGITNGNGISVDDNSVDVVIANNTIQAIHDSGVGTHNGSARTIIEGNTITYTGGVGHGVDVFGAPETIVRGNTIKSAPSHGVYIHTSGAYIPERCIVADNLLLNITGDGVQIFASADDEIHDCVVTGNVVYDPSLNGVYLGNGVQRTLVANNVLYSGGESGIRMVHSAGKNPYRNAVIGNYARGFTQYGVDMSSTVQECMVVGNYLLGNTLGPFSIANNANFVGENSTADGYTLGHYSPLRLSGVGGRGYLELIEQSSAPSAPATNEVRVYPEDNGSGKTRLMARFATGAAVQVAIEP